ncbi:MAG: hypothetical protein A3I00_05840 [Betaproteobacteria bacterium RIFCSPLOWO2_02_FULL_64_12]|nr:MAG: hypothetical protein A3I00_05840 [Betaproteobacteria bacterium RIFCSPLOWO2_02_FULL_64_12]
MRGEETTVGSVGRFAALSEEQIEDAFRDELEDAVVRATDTLGISGSVLGAYDLYTAVLDAVLTESEKARQAARRP